MSGMAATVGGCLSGGSSGSSPTPTESIDGRTRTPADGQTTTTAPPSGEDGQSTATPTPEPPYPGFDRVVDAVDNLGCDPTGESPCDAAIEQAIADGTVIRFPAGQYRFDRGHRYNVGRLGFVGEGEVTFVPPNGFNDTLFGIVADRVLFTGIDLDLRAESTTAGLRIITGSGFRIEDLEFLGRGTHPDGAVVNALSLAVTNRGEEGLVKNVRAVRGSAIGHYKGGNGRVGIWIGSRHSGRITVESCHLEEFGNNGIYGSRSFGSTRVIGGEFRNNNVAGVRVDGDGNAVTGVTIEVDLDKYGGPTTMMGDNYNTRAIVVEQGPYVKAGRVPITDCDIRIRNADRSQGAIAVWPTGNGPRIENTRIETGVDWAPAIRAVEPADRTDDGPPSLEIVNSTIIGDGDNGSAIELRHRPTSLLEGTTIEQTGANRDGLQLIASNRCRIASTAISTTRYPVFAINPSGDDSSCLISVTGEIQIGQRTFDSDVFRSTALDQSAESAGTGDQDDGSCIGPSILAELDEPSGIGITAIEDGTVSWIHRSEIETAINR